VIIASQQGLPPAQVLLQSSLTGKPYLIEKIHWKPKAKIHWKCEALVIINLKKITHQN
jgi:hypothetical protein